MPSYVFVSQYALEAGELRCTDCSFYEPLLWVESFGTEQEVFAKLTGFGAVGKEISLVLLAQGGACNHVQLIYSPQWQYLSVDICDENHPNFGNVWMLGRTLNVGDQLGARVLQPGNRIEVFVNGQRIDTVDVSEFLFTSGSIGLIGFSDANVTLSWDDFGGGNYE